MKIAIVTTFSDSGYDMYARYFVESLKKFVNIDIDVILYVDDVKIDISENKNFRILKLEENCPELVEFKKRNKDRQFKNFLQDAVRFSHKSYAIHHAATNFDYDVICWIDADTEIFSDISSKYLLSFLPAGFFTSYLGRPGSYTETGFIEFNLKDSYSKEFFYNYINWYNNDTIYTLPSFTDCHVFDATRIQMEQEGKIKGHNLTPGMGKNNFNATFKNHMIHLKGDRKENREEIINRILRN